MPNIVVLSDTHSKLGRLLKDAQSDLVKALDECDIIFHLGDGEDDVHKLELLYPSKVVYVRGNCDQSSDTLFRIIDIENIRFLLTHGHKFSVKSTLIKLELECRYRTANVGLFGHSHRVVSEDMGDLLLLNPGSIATSKTYMVIAVDKDKISYKIFQI